MALDSGHSQHFSAQNPGFVSDLPLKNSRLLPQSVENEGVLSEKHLHFHSLRKKDTPPKKRPDNDWEFDSIYYSGTFCEVRKARPAGRNVPYSYAVKRLKSRWLGTGLGEAMLQREHELGQLVSHQHIVPTLSANFDTDSPYLVQPWLEGKTIHEFLTLGRRATVQETIWIARQISDALRMLEKYHYCHSDLKPENMIVSPTGHATLIDLGLARRFNEPCSMVDRSVCGTPSYMAPECFLPGQNIDIRADIYSLGAVLIEMLAGTSPFYSNRLEIPEAGYGSHATQGGCARPKATARTGYGIHVNFSEKRDLLSTEYTPPEKMLQQYGFEGETDVEIGTAENIAVSRSEMVEKMFVNLDHSCTSAKFCLLLNAMIADDPNERPDSASGLFRQLVDLELSSIR